MRLRGKGYPLNSIEQNAETLSSFGMTVKQAKVYLSLVFLGTAAVGEISKHSKVRREEVYRILPKLEKMGLIEKTLSTPVKLKATSVENALEILIKNEEEKAKNRIAELSEKKAEFLKHFQTSSKESKMGDGEQFSLTSEKAVALSKIKALIDSAQTQIEYVSSREKILQFVKFYSESLTAAIGRGVKFRFISNPAKGEDQLRKAVRQVFADKSGVSVRYSESLPNHFLIADSKQVLIATSTEGYLADKPLLWSNNLPHVRVYKKLFEDLWESSVELVALNVSSDTERLISFVKKMKPSQHVILLYETVDAKFKALLTYLKFGLQNGEAAVYVCSESSVEEVTAAMTQIGIDVAKHQKSGALKVLDYTQHYIVDGQFEITTTEKLWRKYYDEAVSKGFRGLRVAGETACFFKHNIVKELVEYEQHLHKNPSVPMIAICAFRAEQLMNPENPVNVYSELVKAHGKVLFSWLDKELGRVAIS
jgi:sugar-specific transcriptional regulator TrmB